MKTKLFSLIVAAAGFIALGARAQVAEPSTPAPAMDVLSSAPQANQVVYAPRLPAVNELTNVAAAQGLTIEKVVQSVSSMTVVYRSANGQVNTVAYLLLPAAGAPAATSTVAIAPTATTNASPVTTAVVGTTTPTVVAMASPAPQVVYVPSSPAPAYYYDPFYYPYYNYGYPWYGPVSVSFGLGYYSGRYYGGGYHGGGGHGGHGGRGGHH